MLYGDNLNATFPRYLYGHDDCQRHGWRHSLRRDHGGLAMTPPARGRPRKKTVAVVGDAVQDKYSWSTADELTFLRGLGMEVFCDKDARESRAHLLAPRNILLQRYLAAMPRRTQWGDIDAVKVGVHIHAMLKAMMDDHSPRARGSAHAAL